MVLHATLCAVTVCRSIADCLLGRNRVYSCIRKELLCVSVAQFLSNVVESSFTWFRGYFFIHVTRGSEKGRPVVRPVKLVSFVPYTAFSLDARSGNKVAGVVIIFYLNLFL